MLKRRRRKKRRGRRKRSKEASGREEGRGGERGTGKVLLPFVPGVIEDLGIDPMCKLTS